MDERHDRSRNIVWSAARAVVGGVALISAAAATAAVISLLTFVIALFAVPFLPHLTAVVGASAVVLLLVKWINRCSNPCSAKSRVSIRRICGGVIAAVGVLVAFSLRNLAGNDGQIAIAIGLLFVVVGAALVLTSHHAGPGWHDGDASPDSTRKASIDRRNRNLLVDAIRRYLSERITAFEFDDEIFKISEGSADPTVNHTVLGLWSLYDDLKDHKVVLSKEGWDYCQRLILLLESDAQVETQKRKRWSINQLVAGAALLVFIVCAARIGFGYRWLALAVPFGIVSIGLSRLHGNVGPDVSTQESIALMPFSRVQEILGVRRRVSGFKKQKYPANLATRRIRSPGSEFVLGWPVYAYWLALSPIVLLWQTLPDTEFQTRVVAD